MKTTVLAVLSYLGLLTLQILGQSVKNEFPIVIEGVSCKVTAYRPQTPIVFEPMVAKDFHPKSQLLLAIMIGNSDIGYYLSDEEIFETMGLKVDKEKAQEYRESVKKMYEVSGPNAEENPWKGMKYVLDQAFVVESEKGKFLVHQLSTQGGKRISGKVYGSVKQVNGKWSIGGEKSEAGKKFQYSMVKLVPHEFTKLHEASSVEPLPLEDLLK